MEREFISLAFEMAKPGFFLKKCESVTYSVVLESVTYEKMKSVTKRSFLFQTLKIDLGG